MAADITRTRAEEVADAWLALDEVARYLTETREHLARPGDLAGAHRCVQIAAAMAARADGFICAARRATDRAAETAA